MAKKTKEQIQKELTKEISKRFNLDAKKVTRDLNFLKDVDADSIDFVELVMELEEEYDIEIPDEDAAKLITLGQTIDYIHKKAL